MADVTSFLEQAGVDFDVLDHPRTERATDEAGALGVDPGQVAKTLVVRVPSGNVRAVVAASTGPVIAAGSVDSYERILTLASAGVWGYTIGGGIIAGRMPGGPSVAGQVREVLAMTARADAEAAAAR